MLKIEYKRQALHIGMVLFALLLVYLNKWQALLLALVALLFNFVIVPKMGIKHHVYREEEHRGAYAKGFIAYPLSIIILVLVYPLNIASVAWGIMGFGDGFSNIFGRLFGKRKLFWNKSKSYVGFFAFIIFAFPVALFLMLWNGVLLPIESILIVCLIASVVGAVVESLPTKINDNLSVPIVTATLIYFLIL
tara:strand:- start:167 stop:742 length:576 start_codon:yes stop_codon:yes gene_type:complete